MKVKEAMARVRTLNFTMNPVSHSLSLLTFVNAKGVFNGFPPLGISSMSSSCCAYKARKAAVRPPFCSAVTPSRNLKQAIRVMGVLSESVIMNCYESRGRYTGFHKGVGGLGHGVLEVRYDQQNNTRVEVRCRCD